MVGGIISERWAKSSRNRWAASSRNDGRLQPESAGYICTDHAIRYLASVPDCRACPLKAKCCPKMPARRVVRDVNEAARDVARDLAKTEAFARSHRDRKKIEMLFAHLKHSALRSIAPARTERRAV
jgi:hypothetical protein